MSSSLWRHSGFLHLWGAQAVSTLGNRIGREAITLAAVILLGASPMDLAWLNLASALPYVFFGLAAGVLIDRVRRRPLLIAADLIRAALLVLLCLAALLGVLHLALLLAVMFLVTSCNVLFDSAHHTYIPTLIDKRHLVDANAKQESTAAAAEIVGPPIGGVLVQSLGAPFAILCDAISYLVSALLIWRVPDREKPREGATGRVTFEEMRVGFRVIFGHRLFRPLALAKTIRAICGGAVGAFYVLYVFGELQVSAAMLGVVVGFGGVAALLAAIVTTRIARVTPAGPGIIAGFAAAALGNALLPLAGLMIGTWAVIPLLILGQLLGDFGLAYAFSMERALRQHRIDNALLGRATIAIAMCGNVPGPIGAILAGVAAEYVGLTPVLWVCAAGYAMSPLLLLLSDVRGLRRVEAT
jgi:MFS family permease